jgi:cytoskeleton protein RodZ
VATTALPASLLALMALLVAAAGLIGLRQGLLRRATPQASPTAPKAASEATPEAGGQAADPPSGGVPAARDELVLQPSEPSWLEVRSAEGTTLFRGILDTEQRFPLDAELEVLAGRPDLVLVRLGPSPAGPMGTIDDVRWRRFRADQAPSP